MSRSSLGVFQSKYGRVYTLRCCWHVLIINTHTIYQYTKIERFQDTLRLHLNNMSTSQMASYHGISRHHDGTYVNRVVGEGPGPWIKLSIEVSGVHLRNPALISHSYPVMVQPQYQRHVGP